MKFLKFVLTLLGGVLKVLLVLVGGYFVVMFVFGFLVPLLRCIGEGTLVETPQGPRAVETLRVGDAVLSVTESGLAEGKVVAVRKSVALWWRRLSFAGGSSLDLTAVHPIAGTTGWRPAGDLQVGELIRTKAGFISVEATETRFGLIDVYDLSVEPHENFIAAGVVMHNKTIRPLSASAIGECRAVGSSQVAYASSNNGAFGRLECLAVPTSCGWEPGTTSFLDPQLASLKPRHGYARSFFAGAVAKGKPDPGIETFVYAATPVRVGETGTRGFAIDHTGLICFTTDGTIPPIEKGALAPTCTPLK